MLGNSESARQVQESDNPFDTDPIPQESLLENPFGPMIPGSGEREPQGLNPFDVPPVKESAESAAADPLPGEEVEKLEKVDSSVSEEPLETQPLEEFENNGEIPKLPSEKHQGQTPDVQVGKQDSSEDETTNVGQPAASDKSSDASYSNLSIWIYFLPIALIVSGVVFQRWWLTRRMKAQGFSKLKGRKVPQKEAENFRVGNSLKSSPDNPANPKFKTKSSKTAESQAEPGLAFSEALLNFSDSTILNPEDFSEHPISDEIERMPVFEEPATVTASQADAADASQFNSKQKMVFAESAIGVSGESVVSVGATVSESGGMDLGQLADTQTSEPATEFNDDDFDFSNESEGAKAELNGVSTTDLQGSDESEKLIGSQHGSDEFEFDFSEDEDELDFELEIEDAFDMESKAAEMEDGLVDDLAPQTPSVEIPTANDSQVELPAATNIVAATATAGAAVVADVDAKIGGVDSDAHIRELESELSKWKENAAKFESETDQLSSTLKRLEQNSELEARRAEEFEKQIERIAGTEAELTGFKSKLERAEQSLKDAREETQAELVKNESEIAELKSRLETAELSLKKASEEPQAELAEKNAEIVELKSMLETAVKSLKDAKEETQAELDRSGAEMAELKSRLETTEQSLKIASEEPQAKLAEKEAEIAELRSKLETTEQSLKTEAQEEIQMGLASDESKSKELESKLAAASQQIEAAKAEQAELRSQLATVTASLENREEDSSLAEELASSKKQLAEALDKKNALRNKLRMLLVKFEKLKGKREKVDPDDTGILASGPNK